MIFEKEISMSKYYIIDCKLYKNPSSDVLSSGDHVVEIAKTYKSLVQEVWEYGNRQEIFEYNPYHNLWVADGTSDVIVKEEMRDEQISKDILDNGRIIKLILPAKEFKLKGINNLAFYLG